MSRRTTTDRRDMAKEGKEDKDAEDRTIQRGGGKKERNQEGGKQDGMRADLVLPRENRRDSPLKIVSP